VTLLLLDQQIFQYVIVMLRVGGILAFLPFFGDTYIPAIFRVAFLVVASIAISYNISVPDKPDDVVLLLLMALAELMMGLSIGIAMKILESALHVLGLVFANQSGLSSGMMFDHTQNSQGSVYGSFLSLCFVAMIVASDLHLRLLEAIANSYRMFAVGAFVNHHHNFVSLITRAAGDAFNLGIQMSAPFLTVGVLFSLAAGVLSRLMPQMQVFLILMPAQILLHSIIFFFVIGAVVWWFAEYYINYFSNVFGV
jgi:flagellar biosynthetic protein FliR